MCGSSTGSGSGGGSGGGVTTSVSESEAAAMGEKLGVNYNNASDSTKDELNLITGVEKVSNGKLSADNVGEVVTHGASNSKELNSKISESESTYKSQGYSKRGAFTYNGASGTTKTSVMEKSKDVVLIKGFIE